MLAAISASHAPLVLHAEVLVPITLASSSLYSVM